MAENSELVTIELNEQTVRNKIYFIRGQKVMLDADLAEIYGYTTKAFNQQIKNNEDRFPDDFRFQVSKSEKEEILRSKNLTSSWGGARTLPYAFTEQGIYMLMSVLKGDLAVRQSITLIRLFKSMKDYIVENRDLIGHKELLQLAVKTNQNTQDIAEIKETMATKEDLKKVMDNFLDPSMYKHFLILDGQKIEADVAYTKIYKSAKKTIFIIDNYVGLKTLELLNQADTKADITIFSDNIARPKLTQTMINDYINEHPGTSLAIKPTGHKFHDRYIVIDYKAKNEKIYHFGASSKDAGKLITTIMKIDDTQSYHAMIDGLI